MKTILDFVSINSILDAYLTAALFSSSDINKPDDDSSFLDQNYSIDQFSEESKLKALKEIEDFCYSNSDTLVKVYLGSKELSEKEYESVAEDIGHNFWFNRNRHGTGFWDNGPDPLWLILSDASRIYGEIHIYEGDNGELFFN